MQRRPQMSRRPSVGGRNPRQVQVKQPPRVVIQTPKKRAARKPGS
jgi:hypothetical protein